MKLRLSVLPQADLQGRLRQGQRVLHGAGRVLVQARAHRPHLQRVPALPGMRQRILREAMGVHVSALCIIKVKDTNLTVTFSPHFIDASRDSAGSCATGLLTPPTSTCSKSVRVSPFHEFMDNHCTSRSAIGDFTPSDLNINFSSGGQGIIARGDGRGDSPR